MKKFWVILILFSCAIKKETRYIDPWLISQGTPQLKLLKIRPPEVVDSKDIDLSFLKISSTDLIGEWYSYDYLTEPGFGSVIIFKQENGIYKMSYQTF